jgi:DNA-binding Lrp family transcriptional regulator
MDELDRQLLDALQRGLPLEADPYAALGREVGVDGDTAFARVMALLDDGTIRRLGASWDSRRLGFAPTLVAVRLPAERVAEVAALINRYAEVTHNYERRGRWNLWFTLIARSESRQREILDELRRDAGLSEGDLMNVPVERMLKIEVTFPTK